jgi:phage terminase large subunit-like protein
MPKKTVVTLIPPRWGTTRDKRRKTRGPSLALVAQAMGFELFPWQKYVVDTAMEYRNDHYAYRTVGVAVGRQNGKSSLVATRIAFEAISPRHRIAYTAQDRNMARAKWEEHVEILLSSPFKNKIKHVVRTNGNEHVIFKNGSTYQITTPNNKGGRGSSLDLVVIDEALTHDLSLIGALQPTLATKPNGQLWILSNAGDERSTLLAHYRNLAHSNLKDGQSRLAWFEWAPHEDKFDHLDEKVWRQAIPSLGQKKGVTIEAVREAANTNAPEIFTREWLNVWAAKEATQVIDTELWDGLVRSDVIIGGDVVLGVDMTRERDKACIAATGFVSGLNPIEIVDMRDGTAWLQPRLIEVAKKWNATVVIDTGSPAASVLGHLELAGIKVLAIGLQEYARACGNFYDAVQARSVCHLGDDNLRQAILGSAKRPLGDAWAWNRRSTSNITPLVAATLAHYGMTNLPTEVPILRSRIF